MPASIFKASSAVRKRSGFTDVPAHTVGQEMPSVPRASGPTGTEALKNLVLGGIAAFTVVDGCEVGAADTGNNFMVDSGDVGRNRAAAVAGPLRELNESVAGACVEEDPTALLEAQPAFFHRFTLVIATQAGPRHRFRQRHPLPVVPLAQPFLPLFHD